MSLKEISDEMEKGNVLVGIKQTLKYFKSKNAKKSSRVFVSKDVREETIKKLEDMKIEFEVLKSKEEIAKVLGLDFESEVFLIK